MVTTRKPYCFTYAAVGSLWPNVPYTRESNRIRGCCTKHYQGHSSTGPREEKSYPQHDNPEKAANVGCVWNTSHWHGGPQFLAVNALTQLEDFVKEKKYADVAQTLAVCIYDISFPGVH